MRRRLIKQSNTRYVFLGEKILFILENDVLFVAHQLILQVVGRLFSDKALLKLIRQWRLFLGIESTCHR